MRPIIAGLCTYEGAKNGTLDLADFALMNDALSVESENTWRMREAQREKESDG